MPDQGVYRYLPSQLADRLRGLTINVGHPMAGATQGRHRSHAFGSSVEFAEYRAYTPGDPIRRIDWAVYARSDRYVIRQFHDEVSIRAHVLLDVSESMTFGGEGRMTKLDYARYLAAAFMYVMIQQGDAAGLMTFDDAVRDAHEAAASLAGLKPILRALETLGAARAGNIETVLHDVAERVPGRGLVVVISDLLQPSRQILNGIHHLAHGGKDVTVFHVLDPAELRLPDNGLYELEELETRRRLVVDLAHVRSAYEARVTRYLDELRGGCANIGATYLQVDTQTDIRDVLQRRSLST